MEEKKKIIIIIGTVILGLVYFISQTDFSLSNIFGKSIDEDVEFNISKGDNVLIVQVSGEVMLPNVYVVKEGTILLDLLNLATLKTTSDIRNLNLADLVDAHSHYKITSIYDDEETTVEKPTNPGGNNNQNGLVNLNTATKEQLMTLNGIGSATADNIINYRKANIFYSINDIKNVSGIGNSVFDRIKNYITV